MQVEATIDSPLIFSGDSINAKIKFIPGEPIHILSAGVYIQTALQLGDLVETEPFEVLRARGAMSGHIVDQPQGIWGMLGLGEKSKDYKLYSSDQCLLCTDVQIHDSTTFNSTLQIPTELCPSYASKSLAIHHELVIDFQILKDGLPTPCLLMLPFRIYPRSMDKYDVLREYNSPKSSNTVKHRVLEHLDSLLQQTKEATPQPEDPLSMPLLPKKVNFDLIKDKKALASIHLARPFIHIGECLIGQVRLLPDCFHLSVMLEMTETLEESLATAKKVNRKLIASQSYTVYGLSDAPFQLPTPATYSPQVSFKQFKTQFSLRIELTRTIEKAFDEHDAVFKSQISTEVVSTSIPITVVAPAKGGSVASKIWGFS